VCKKFLGRKFLGSPRLEKRVNAEEKCVHKPMAEKGRQQQRKEQGQRLAGDFIVVADNE